MPIYSCSMNISNVTIGKIYSTDNANSNTAVGHRTIVLLLTAFCRKNEIFLLEFLLRHFGNFNLKARTGSGGLTYINVSLKYSVCCSS